MPTHEETMNANKSAVARFNEAVIERGDERAFFELVADDFVNRSAPPGTSPGRDGMWFFLSRALRPALSDLRVEIHDQIAEDDRVVTRKTIRGAHRGALFGISATGKSVEIEVIDIVRLRDGRYVEHWSLNTLASLLANLRAT